MSKADVYMYYSRVERTYNGQIMVQVHPTRGFLQEAEFTAYSFARMIGELSRVMRTYDETPHVYLSRTDMKVSKPYSMGEQEIEQLRNDPAAAIESMSPPDRVVHVRDKPSPPAHVLRAGHDTLADAFGDEVYLRCNSSNNIECPGCGRWRCEPTVLYGSRLQSICSECHVYLYVRVVGSWAIARVDHLLNQPVERYFIPRRWNNGLWISKTDLQAKYKKFIEERDACSKDDPKA